MDTITIPEKTHRIIRGEVIDVIREVLSDPDRELDLTPAFGRHLTKSLKEKRAGKVTPLSDMFVEYGI